MEKSNKVNKEKVRYQFERLCRIVLHGVAVDCYRHMGYRREHETLFSELPEGVLEGFSAEDEYEADQYLFHVCGYEVAVRDGRIAQALNSLTERKREVILLFYFLGMNSTEVAKTLGLSCSTVHGHRVRALEILQEAIENYAERKD